MASLPIAFSPAAGRVFAATAAKGAGETKKEKGLIDWIVESLNKDHLLETDPVLQKVEGKDVSAGNGTSTVRGGRKTSVQVPPKKNGGGFGGLFAKKDGQ